MNAAASLGLPLRCSPSPSAPRPHRLRLGFPRVHGWAAVARISSVGGGGEVLGAVVWSGVLRRRVMAAAESRMGMRFVDREEEEAVVAGGGVQPSGVGTDGATVAGECDCLADDGSGNVASGIDKPMMSTVGRSTNIVWHECPLGKLGRQKLLGQKGCVIWITGLSGSGKSTLACALSRELYCRGHLSYVLDGDNVRHGLNKDLSFKPEDRAENIRRIGEVAKLFADAGIICIASLISPYRRDRDTCRVILPENAFIEVFMDMPLEVCEARDAKGLYKLARAGKIKGFTGIDDPYEPPLNCEITIQQKDGVCPSPAAMAEQVISYLESNGYFRA